MKTIKILPGFITLMVMITLYGSAQDLAEPDLQQPVTAMDVMPIHTATAIPLDGYFIPQAGRQALSDLPAGTYEVGDDQPVLKKLTDVAAQLNSSTVTGDIIYELNSSYDGTIGETFPVVFTQYSASGGDWTVTIRVKAGISSRATTGNTDQPLIVLNGADNLVFDGRAGGTGTSVAWNLYNSNANGTVFRLINDAQFNTLTYLDMVSLHKTLGVVTFGATTGELGNDNNSIANCNIHDDGTNSPGFGIYSNSNVTDETAFNSGNIITACNIYNIYSEGGESENISLREGNTGWNITGNSFYQTVNRTPGTVITGFTMIDIQSGDSYQITGNYFGGSAPQCGGSPFTVSGFQGPRYFYAIAFYNLGANDPISIEGNVIKNIHLEYKNTSLSQLTMVVFAGMLITDGVTNITNNTIGSGTEVSSIHLECNQSIGGYNYGIFIQGGLGGLINNNELGGFTLIGNTINYLPTSPSPSDLTLITLNNVPNIVPYIVSGNILGSLTTANSVSGTVASGTTGYMRLTGMTCSASQNVAGLSITGNTVANFSLSGNNNQIVLKGIVASSNMSGNIVSNNTVRNLYNSTPNVSTSNLGMCSIVGMQFLMSAPATASNNHVYDLNATHGSATTLLAGMFVQTSPATGGSFVLENNFIHNVNNLSSSVNSYINGINIAGTGSLVLKNNMISLGARPDGSTVSNGCQILGIVESNGNNSHYNNSVYLGGAVASGATGNTYAFNSTSTATVRNITGNIFFNARSGGTTGKHYAIRLANNNPALVICNNNLLLANGSVGGTLGFFGSNITSLEAWKIATGLDLSSGVGNPNFINPMGTISSTNLHIQNPTPIESGGVALAEVIYDFDGEARSGLTPADIGADAGNFISSGDIFGPTISYQPLLNYTTANRSVENFAIVVDNISIATGDNRPRLYFKRSTDASVFAGNTSADNGWKFVQATNTTSPYSFLVDYSLLYGGSVTSGTVIQYFVAAQDGSDNLNSLPAGVTASASPKIQNINGAPAVVNQYITSDVMLSGTINIPGTYPTITGEGGFFQAVNNNLVSGDIVVIITANLTETGVYGLNQVSTYPEAVNFNIMLKPSEAIEKVITGAVANGMIRFDGGDNVTIDGNFEGAGKYLRIVNTNNANPTITIQNDANYITLRNIRIEGANATATSGVVFIGGSSASTGNNYIFINDNEIRNLSSGSGIPHTLIHSTGTAFRVNGDNTISNNLLYNFSANGINITATGNGNYWTIEGNHIYCALPVTPTTAQAGILLQSAVGGNVITNNFIGGSLPACQGSAWNNKGTSFYGMNLSMGKDIINQISGNTVKNILLSGTGTTTFYGIYSLNTWMNAYGNTVGGTTGTFSVTKQSPGAFYGISLGTVFDRHSIIHHNTAGDLLVSGSGWYATMPMSVSGDVEFTFNQVGNPSLPVSVSVNSYLEVITNSVMVYGISANISGYFANNVVAGIVQTNPVRPGTFAGMSFANVFPKTVENNLIINCGPGSSSNDTTDVSGMVISPSANVNSIYRNNVIILGYGVSNNHSYKGIKNEGSIGTSEIYNNSISIGGTCTGNFNSQAYYKYGSSNTVLKNNIFANFRENGHNGTGNHFAAMIRNVTNPLSSDYNDFYSYAGQAFRFGADSYALLSEWQTATGKDMHSKYADPLYYDVESNLKVCSPEVENAGIALEVVTTDFTGAERSDPPDMGAYEFTLPVASITTGSTNDFCNGELLTAHSTKSPATYLWSTEETTQQIFLNIAEEEEGYYSVYVTDGYGCQSEMPAIYHYVPEELTSSYTLLGFDEAVLGENNVVINGAMGLMDGMTAYVKKNAVVNGPGSFVKAAIIDAHPTAVIGQKIFEPVVAELPVMHYNTQTGPYSNVTVGNNTTTTLSQSGINLTVGQYSNVTLTGTVFGNIQAGKGSTITFLGNSLDIENLRSLPGTAMAPVTFAFTANTELRVKEKVDMDVYGIVNPDNYKVVFYIGKQTGNPGMLLVKAAGAIFNASAYVPSGQIHVLTDGLKTAPALMNGKFIAGKILGTGKNVNWNWYDCEGEMPAPAMMPLAAEPMEQIATNAVISISPVPNNGLFRVILDTPSDASVCITVYNCMGIAVKHFTESPSNGLIDKEIDLRPASPGVYTIMIINKDMRIVRKIVIR